MSKQIYKYKGNPYIIVAETKIKVGDMWKDCVVYKCEYPNPDGNIWVRQRNEFFELFKLARPTMSKEEYSKIAPTFNTTMDNATLFNYSFYGFFSEMGEVIGKLTKALRGDYTILPDGVSATSKYINNVDIIQELGDVLWMVNAYRRVIPNSNKHLTSKQGILSACTDAEKAWYDRMFEDSMFYIEYIINELGYTLEEVLYLNIEKLKERAKNNFIQGNGDGNNNRN